MRLALAGGHATTGAVISSGRASFAARGQRRTRRAGGAGGAAAKTYWIPGADGRSTETLVAAGHYGYAHSCVTSEHFPVRQRAAGARQLALLELGREVSSWEAIEAAARLGLARPDYEDALRFAIAHPDVQRERPIVFLHEPWFGLFGRWDVICLWSNAGRRELGLEDFDGRWSARYRFAFVRR